MAFIPYVPHEEADGLLAELYDRYGASCALKQTNEPAGASITVWLDAAPSHEGGEGTHAGVDLYVVFYVI